ncbi:Plant transposase (Ptta/En/Spm family) [Carex littledalei]|uniref:Plant transposase (Ptta/En/Spm family) n=1 Tax=Carex littledalei TaxID=544730 RepID=A0A833QHC1_9POAL|nr:Plant transposase (Ptta/En/Spm family) [Carex littledalei]
MAPRKSALKRAKSATYKKKKRTIDERNEIGESSMGPIEGEVQPPTKKGRGPGIVRDATEDVEQRPEIWVVGKKEFTCAIKQKIKPKDITASITRLALNFMPGPIRSYHNWDKSWKDIFENAFLERFRYRADQDVSRCRAVLDAIAAKRYTEELNKARTKCIKKFGDDIDSWKSMVPHWCLQPSHWAGLCDIFNTEDWKGLSKQNKENRLASGFAVPHYGGCSSAHQHLNKLKTLKKGGAPTMRELYVHLHSRTADGKSPVLAKYNESVEGASELNDNDEGTVSLQPIDFDITSLKFTTEKAEKVFTDVTGMTAHEDHADVDEADLFMSAVGGSYHGRVRGFGCVLDPKLPKTAGRGRATPAQSDLSDVTNIGSKRIFTDDVLVGMLNERDMRLAEERQERKREQERYNMLFTKLFSLVGQQNPAVQAQVNSAHEGVMGNMQTLQVKSLNLTTQSF